jgi:hypothetical protein
VKHVSHDFTRFKKDLIELMEMDVPESDIGYIYSEMLFNIGLVREENFDLSELRLLNTAFKELRHALKVFKPYRSVPKAAVFGSARTPKNHPNFKLAAQFGKKLAQKGWMVITGGASGIMEAAMVGAGAENSFGLNIMLPFEQDANPVIKNNPKLMYFKYFFTRKLMFLKESQATVLFPGGFGTFDEGFESFTLTQTGKAKPRPLVLVDVPGSRFWTAFLSYVKNYMGKEGLISPNDLTLLRHYQHADKAVFELKHFYSNYESSRFLKDRYLVRFRRPLSPEQFERLNKDFRDILKSGSFDLLGSTEEDDNKDPNLQRLKFHFDRSNYARLRDLIDTLNSF